MAMHERLCRHRAMMPAFSSRVALGILGSFNLAHHDQRQDVAALASVGDRGLRPERVRVQQVVPTAQQWSCRVRWQRFSPRWLALATPSQLRRRSGVRSVRLDYGGVARWHPRPPRSKFKGMIGRPVPPPHNAAQRINDRAEALAQQAKDATDSPKPPARRKSGRWASSRNTDRSPRWRSSAGSPVHAMWSSSWNTAGCATAMSTPDAASGAPRSCRWSPATKWSASSARSAGRCATWPSGHAWAWAAWWIPAVSAMPAARDWNSSAGTASAPTGPPTRTPANTRRAAIRRASW